MGRVNCRLILGSERRGKGRGRWPARRNTSHVGNRGYCVPCEDVAAARGRAVGLASGVVRWLKKGEPMPAWIFPSPEGTALEERNVRTVFARLLAKADMRQICIHDLRHTYSTLLLQAGAPSPTSASSPDIGTPRSLQV
jgi:integrase